MTLEDLIVTHGFTVFNALLLGGFLAIALWESFSPLRVLAASTPRRWFTNIGITAIHMTLVRLLMPVLVTGIALDAQARGIGLLNLIELPRVVELALAVLLLDLLHYGQHLAMHRVPWLWRMHMIHHADVDFDVSTNLRFHPFEAFFTKAVLIAGVLVSGAAPAAVILYYLLYLANGYFSHANVVLPAALERRLRWWLVTPDMHRIHHSADLIESNRNLSSLFSWWDRLFGTYHADPAGGHVAMQVGLAEYRDPKALGILALLRMPFDARRERTAVPAADNAVLSSLEK